MPRWSKRTVEERFFAKTRKTDTCWLWTAYVDGQGYARLQVDGVSVYAHVWAYEHFVGEVPDGLQLDHRCHEFHRCAGGTACPHRRCVNPNHLQLVTRRENVLRGNGVAGEYARRTHCKNGHEFTPENTSLRPSGARLCRECNRAAQQRRRARSR